MDRLKRVLYGQQLQENGSTGSFPEVLDKNDPNGSFEIIYNIEELIKELEICRNYNKRKDKIIEELQDNIHRLHLRLTDSQEYQPVSLFKKQKSIRKSIRKSHVKKKSIRKSIRKSRKKYIRK